jgi:hypothetical protein
MPTLCRPAHAQDLERAAQLVVASINDLIDRLYAILIHAASLSLEWRRPSA